MCMSVGYYTNMLNIAVNHGLISPVVCNVLLLSNVLTADFLIMSVLTPRTGLMYMKINFKQFEYTERHFVWYSIVVYGLPQP